MTDDYVLGLALLIVLVIVFIRVLEWLSPRPKGFCGSCGQPLPKNLGHRKFRWRMYRGKWYAYRIWGAPANKPKVYQPHW
jgi:hypothetical protein